MEPPRDDKIRPTSDRVRENIFNILQHRFVVDGYQRFVEASFLDLCCGTGAMGVEAISRGFKNALLVDNSDEAAILATKNIKKIGDQNGNSARFIRGDILNLSKSVLVFDYIFLDPPYCDFPLNSAVAAITKQGYLGKNSLLIIETSKKLPLPPSLVTSMKVLDSRIYGISQVWFLAENQSDI